MIEKESHQSRRCRWAQPLGRLSHLRRALSSQSHHHIRILGDCAMYCPSCGKSIPDGSTFCLHCGKPISVQAPKLNFSDRPPRHIAEVGWSTDVPTKTTLLGKTLRGYRIWFQLLDESRQPTRGNGTAYVTMGRWTYPPIFLDVVMQPYYVTAHQANIKVAKSDFGPSSKDQNFLGFFYNVEEAVLTDGERYRLEVRFETSDGQRLLGRSSDAIA